MGEKMAAHIANIIFLALIGLEIFIIALLQSRNDVLKREINNLIVEIKDQKNIIDRKETRLLELVHEKICLQNRLETINNEKQILVTKIENKANTYEMV